MGTEKADIMAVGVAVHAAAQARLEGGATDGEARGLVEELLRDLDGRSGGDHFLGSLTPDVRAELEDEWTRIAGEHMDRACFGAPDGDDTDLPF